jgi:hypothetical protein
MLSFADFWGRRDWWTLRILHPAYFCNLMTVHMDEKVQKPFT